MFSMPVRDATFCDAEGVSDHNPIQLHGESAERFRALLSVFYDLYVAAPIKLFPS